MFERFTASARRVVEIAENEARAIGHREVAAAHLLLGLVGERHWAAARALDRFGMDAHRARRAVADVVGRTMLDAPDAKALEAIRPSGASAGQMLIEADESSGALDFSMRTCAYFVGDSHGLSYLRQPRLRRTA